MLPEFRKPPVVEVAVSVQFDKPALDGPLLMLWWTKVRDRFPKYEQAAPLPSSAETFEGPQGPKLDFHITNAPPTPRLLMTSGTDAEVLQIQEDRLGYSWRKLSSEAEYPRYEKIREVFERELSAFQDFLTVEGLESMSPVQCEVTYVNVIPSGEMKDIHADLGRIIPSASPRLTEGFLPAPEQTRYASQYVIRGVDGAPIGRLYVSTEPSYLLKDKKPIYLMKLTFRGRPLEKAISGVTPSMDIGHEWIVRGFTTLTSSSMHNIWERMA